MLMLTPSHSHALHLLVGLRIAVLGYKTTAKYQHEPRKMLENERLNRNLFANHFVFCNRNGIRICFAKPFPEH